MMTWEWPLAVYLWIAGVAGGAYFSAFLMSRIYRGRHEILMKAAMLLGVPLVLLGSLLLVVDLGEQLRAWHLFTRFRPGSPMSMGSWILLLYAVIGAVLIALWWAKGVKSEQTGSSFLSGVANVLRPATPVIGALSWIALVLAVLLIAYTGVLLSATNQPLWAGVLLLPALFVISAVLTGMALLVLVFRTPLGRWLDGLFGGEGKGLPKGMLHLMAISGLILTVMELVVLIGMLVWLGSFSTPGAASAVSVLLTGPMSLLFLGGVILVGSLIPLALEFASLRGRELIVGSFVVAACLALLGGFFLRLAMLLGGQVV